ncbi:MAG: penicillin-binding protein 2, partial [Candidatus Eremiobacteraeota bacterium]|nr:penicillin-binding protein 2 [Candidatus Eremiobacteraeota bacterium]
MSGFLLVIAFAIVGIAARLIYVQLIDGKVYAAAARANQVRLIPVAAPRGLILDRNGDVVVRSRPSFTVALIPSEVKDPEGT